jgi:site-specific DNA-methyltransferase (adenine-specific)
MLELNRVYLGDCLEVMKQIDDKSIDMILCDLPYGLTNRSWDISVSLDKLWLHYRRIIKTNGAIALFGQEPFSSYLRISNVENWKYDWIWNKKKGCNFVQAKNMPISYHEIISIFSYGKVGHSSQLKEKRMIYNPQGLVKVDKLWHRPKKYHGTSAINRKSHKLERIIEFENYPKSIIEFTMSTSKLHLAQKPIALCEYLIRTYSDDNDLVLDNCCGSGSTLVACINTNRNFIGIELSEEYVDVSKKRVIEAVIESAIESENSNERENGN